MRRRSLLIGTGAVLLGGGAAAAMLFGGEGEEVPVRLGPPVLALPLLRITLGGEDRLLVLLRRREEEVPRALSFGAPWRGERLELRGFEAATLRPLFAAPLVSGRLGEFAQAELLGEQAATVWLYAGGIGAVSAVDGRRLADAAGLEARNPALAGVLRDQRALYRVEDALVVNAGGARRWRIDPRNFQARGIPVGTAAAAVAATAAGSALPPRHLPAAYGAGGATAFRVAEARLGATWFGLPAAEEAMPPVLAALPGSGGSVGGGAGTPPPRFIAAAPPAKGSRQRLWRGALRAAAAVAADDGIAAAGPFRKSPDSRGPTAEQLADPVPVATEPATLWLAGLLTAGTAEPLRLADPPGFLLLHRAESGAAMRLLRLGPDGATLWGATLPFSELVSVLPGEATLVLAGRRPSRGPGTPAPEEILAAVALRDGGTGGARAGTVRAWSIGAEAPSSPAAV